MGRQKRSRDIYTAELDDISGRMQPDRSQGSDLNFFVDPFVTKTSGKCQNLAWEIRLGQCTRTRLEFSSTQTKGAQGAHFWPDCAPKGPRKPKGPLFKP